ncbi:MAG TPA: carbohydrate kinase family protein [Candidatus Nanoarchaeia archaeon]|nr:carbohydrate kinase family protein [Candidatus Nanoarchaeia archaeon]
MYDVIAVGSANIDVFAHTAGFIEKRMQGMVAYPVGEKILIEEIRFSTGGGGTNAAVALARLGHKVGFVGILGMDDRGETIRKELKHECVEDLSQDCAEDCTGYSIVLDSVEHDRTIFVFKGANDHLSYNKIPLKRLKTKWFYFATLLGHSYSVLEKLAEFAKRKNIKILFNTSSYLVKKGPKFLKRILDSTYILVLNLGEAQILVGKGGIDDLMKKLRKLGPKIVIITDGKNGVYASDGKFIFFAKPHHVRVVETTGAGDAFASGFLSGYMRKADIGYGIQVGMLNAESVIQHHGAKNKLLNKREMESALRKSPIRVSKRKI